jgi:4-alpha-glucanotransferase
VDDDLAKIAAAYGVATTYRDGDRRPVTVTPEAVIRVLGLLEVDASTPQARRIALAGVRERTPATIAAHPDEPRPLAAPGVLVDESGTRTDVTEIPAGLTPGWYRLETDDGPVTVVAPPRALPAVPRSWGWMLQLYALHSPASWGLGDLGDLRTFATWTGPEHGASAVLLNPLHAITPVPPVQPSPYTPSSRRFGTPLALRVTDIDAYAQADPITRAEVDALRPEPVDGRIDYDRSWAAKRSATELLWRAAGRPAPPTTAPDLELFATFCALAERFGGQWSRWPTELRHPSSAGVARAAAELDPRVAYHAWLQGEVQRQLDDVRAAAREVGVRVVHDLAVGCDPEGFDGWAWQDVLALGARVGAPPDAFSQQGQDWGLPPWRPDRLDATGYAAYRDLVRALLRQADGLRVDHVAGLFRLWWVPPGVGPAGGTYVHSDAEVMLAVLMLEAQGAMVIGEDLGTVEPEVTEALHARGMLSSAVLWFTRDRDAPGEPLLPPDAWPEQAVASVSTHDLPTVTGFLRAEHVRARAELGLLDDVAADEAKAAVDRAELLDLLRSEGLVGAAPTEDELVVAIHELLAASRSQLVLISPYDVIGEARQPNLPGTVDEYPNWRLPLSVTLDELRTHPMVAEVVSRLRRLR